MGHLGTLGDSFFATDRGSPRGSPIPPLDVRHMEKEPRRTVPLCLHRRSQRLQRQPILVAPLTGSDAPKDARDYGIGYGVGGSAAAGSDYTSLSGSMTVPAGTSRVTIPLMITDDDEVESRETVELTTGGTGYTVGSAGRHTLTITDNDPPPLPIADDGTPPVTTPATPPAVAATVSISDASAEEGRPMTFTVRSEPAASSPLTLSWTVADGSAVGGEDYSESAGGTVTIAAGASTATFQVATTDDRIDEDDETFTVTLGDLPVGVSFAIDGKTATGTIHDDDTAGIALSDQAIWISGIGGAADYAVRLESEPEAPVTIAVTSDTPGVASVSRAAACVHRIRLEQGEESDDNRSRPRGRTGSARVVLGGQQLCRSTGEGPHTSGR